MGLAWPVCSPVLEAQIRACLWINLLLLSPSVPGTLSANPMLLPCIPTCHWPLAMLSRPSQLCISHVFPAKPGRGGVRPLLAEQLEAQPGQDGSVPAQQA